MAPSIRFRVPCVVQMNRTSSQKPHLPLPASVAPPPPITKKFYSWWSGCMEISAARSDSTKTCLSFSPPQKVWSRVVPWHRLSSASSSVWCSSKLQKTWTMRVGCKSCKVRHLQVHTKTQERVLHPGPPLCGKRYPRRPHRTSSAAHHVLLCKRLAAPWPLGQPQEVGGSLSPCLTG